MKVKLIAQIAPFVLPVWETKIKIHSMENQTDIKKVIRQHGEMETFFSGGFTQKSPAQIERLRPAVENTEVAAKLEKLSAKVGKCRKCGLGAERTNAVPGEGNSNAQIVFVGEAPGADEDAQGRPFVGRAGKLLDKIINAMGLQRQDVFICNILKCRPPGNRDPKPDEINSCLPYLQKQIETLNPEIIVALGAHAAKTLLDTSETIGKLRGRFHEYVTSPGREPVKLMPTYHPAYLLRNYSLDNRRKVWDDMKKVLDELNLPILPK